ncbi:MAG: hypothetical protein J6W21_03255 [Bacteroidaceae bacterium]|nr:hypothetical protein [Bacteroidaceae bacterium]
MMRKLFLLVLVGIVAISANAQIIKESSETTANKKSKITGQFDLYVQDAWGVGIMVRKEFNPYFGWNIIGASFMSGWGQDETPDKVGIVNARLMGIRAHTNIFKNLGVYADVTPGYTYMYSSVFVNTFYYGGYVDSKTHCFGLDCSAGFLLGKHLGLGYNFSFFANGNGNSHIHWGRISIIF